MYARQYTPGTSEVNEVFAKISSELLTFADERNLLVEKYWHGFPSWRFSFMHPRGGIACVEVSCSDDSTESMQIYGFWWMDDYDQGIRFKTKYESEVVELADAATELERVFDLILSWEQNILEAGTFNHRESWHRSYTRDEFYKLSDKYPVPAIDS